jgi:hypothetical protein
VIFLSLTFLFFGVQTTTSLSKIDAINYQDVLTSISFSPLSTSNQIEDQINSNGTTSDENIDTPMLYVNSTYGIAINNPVGWTVHDGDMATIYHNQSKSLNVVAEIMAPL